MPTINKVFLDSSILIEAIKGTKTELLDKLLNIDEYDCYINSIVVSEFMFHFLAVNSSVAPLSLKMKKGINEIIHQNDSYKMLQYFKFLDSDSSIIQTVPLLMQQYNLLPNDAIIIATCKINGISSLASYDSELLPVCAKEGIGFITA